MIDVPVFLSPLDGPDKADLFDPQPAPGGRQPRPTDARDSGPGQTCAMDDLTILRRIALDDLEHFDVLVDRYKNRLYRYGLKKIYNLIQADPNVSE